MSVELFTKQFEQLQSRAFVPLGVVEEYRKTCQILENRESIDEHKQQAVNRFRESFDSYLLDI